MDIFKRKLTLKKEVITVLEAMKTVSPDTEEYTKMVKNLETLCSAIEKASKNKMNLWVPIIGGVFSLVGIGCVIFSEETRIITSKAFSFIPKVRV